MKKHGNYQLIGRRMISLLMVLSCVVALIVSPLPASTVSPSADAAHRVDASPTISNHGPAGTHFKRLPLRFELNTGQFDPDVRFTARNRDGILSLTSREAVFEVFKPSVDPAPEQGRQRSASARTLTVRESVKVRLRWVGASPQARITGIEELPGKTHYYTGNDPKKWRRNVPSYRKVRYKGIYPGIDLIHYGDEDGRLEYDYVVAPGADPKRIAVSIEGAETVKIDTAGDLVLRTSVGEIRQPAPRIYQEVSGARRAVAGGYVLRGKREVGFELGSYDVSKPLVIDPQLVYATYMGGDTPDVANDIAVGSDGSVYIAYLAQRVSQRPEFAVRKLSQDGSSIAYTAVLNNGIGNAIAVDATGAAYVVGGASAGFPTRNPIQPEPRDAGDAFVTKLTPDGSDLVYSTFLGGSLASLNAGREEGTDIEVDAAGVAYVVGITNASANNFPLVNPTQATFGGGNTDGFVSIIGTSGSSLLFSTYLGRVGNDQVGREGDEEISSIAVNPQNGDVYLAGLTLFPSNPDAEDIPFMGYLKRTNAAPQLTALDDDSRLYNLEQVLDLLAVYGRERVSFKFAVKLAFYIGLHLPPQPLTSAGEDNSSANSGEIVVILGGACLRASPSATCNASAILATLDLNLTLKSAINLGDDRTRGLDLRAITVSSQGAIYMTGATSSIGTVNPIQATSGGGDDAFVMALAPNSFQVAFATYLGGSRRDMARGISVDQQGNIYVAGVTGSTNFPVTPGALQPTHGGQNPNFGVHDDAFIAKISPVTFPQSAAVQFNASSYSAAEDAGSVTITVTRSGEASSAVAVSYATTNGTASERSDYAAALGTLRFAAGETSKTFVVLITNDAAVEGSETVNLTLANPTGGASLGSQSAAVLTITDNDTAPSQANPVDDPRFFALQHYHDFLNRQPDQSGLDFWADQITSCGADAACVEVRRINVSAAFYISIEFQQTGYLVYRMHQAAFNTSERLPLRSFLPDTQEIGRGVVVGAPGWEQQLEQNKQAFANEFVTRQQFASAYPQTMSAAQFVDALNANTGGSLSQSERDALVAGLTNNTQTRAQVLRTVAEDSDFTRREFNRAFVYMQYVGYLRRGPSDAPDNNLDGYNFWLGKLNQFDGNFIQAEMVKAFISSIEYRARFGTP